MGRLVLILVVRRTLVVAAAVFPRAEQQQVAGDDFSAVFPLPALPILPACRLELAFDVHLGTFGNVLPNDLRQTLPGHDVVPLGPLLPFVVSVLEPFVGSEAEVGDWSAALRIPDLRVFANIPNEDDFVYASGISALLESNLKEILRPNRKPLRESLGCIRKVFQTRTRGMAQESSRTKKPAAIAALDSR